MGAIEKSVYIFMIGAVSYAAWAILSDLRDKVADDSIDVLDVDLRRDSE